MEGMFWGAHSHGSKQPISSHAQWLMPVILAPWEVDIRKIEARGQP
jgi:hypothetical protein